MVGERLLDQVPVRPAVALLVGQHHRPADGAEEAGNGRSVANGLVEQRRRGFGGSPQAGLGQFSGLHEDRPQHVIEAAAHDPGDAVHLGDHHVRSAGRRHGLGQLPGERVQGTSWLRRGELRAVEPADGGRQVFGSGFDEIRGVQFGRPGKQRVAGLAIVQRGDNRRHVAERFVEPTDFQQVHPPQIGAQRIQDRVAGLMGDDVGARTGIGGRGSLGGVEERQRLAVVVGVEVFPGVVTQQQRRRVAGLLRPGRQRCTEDRFPGLDRQDRGLPCLPGHELRRPLGITGRRDVAGQGDARPSGGAIGPARDSPHGQDVDGQGVVGNEVDHGGAPPCTHVECGGAAPAAHRSRGAQFRMEQPKGDRDDRDPARLPRRRRRVLLPRPPHQGRLRRCGRRHRGQTHPPRQAEDVLRGRAGLDAAWEDWKSSFSSWFHWQRGAIVTDVEWMVWATRFFGLLFPGDWRVYPPHCAQDARRWVTDGTDPDPIPQT